MELVRQPIFLLLMTASGVFGVFLAVVPYFGFGDDRRWSRQRAGGDFVSGLVGAVLSASASVAHEIRTGTALAVLAKPVSRVQFLAAKYLGLAGALTALTYFNLLSVLLSSRMAYDAYGSTDKLALWIYMGSVLAAYGVGAFTNYFLNRTFVADAVAGLVVIGTVGSYSSTASIRKAARRPLPRTSIGGYCQRRC